MEDLAEREPSANGMGTMTGWHMLAMDVMEHGVDEEPGEDDDDERRILKPTYDEPLASPRGDSPLHGSLDPPSSPGFSNKRLDKVIKSGGSIMSKGKKGDSPSTSASSNTQQGSNTSPRSMITPVAKATSNFHNDYQVVEEIGAGAFGRAMKARRIEDGELVVAKEVKLGLMSEKERYITKNEVNVLANLDHPNIVKYHDCYADNIMLHIVMEFCGGGDLSGYLKKAGGEPLPEDEIMLKFVQVCLAMQYVHRQGILHRDLKGSNIFLTDDGIIKLGDFGISKVLNDHGAYFSMAQSVVGTPNYMAPEICKSRPYGLKSDIWALGCVLYELCTHRPAFDGNNLPAVVIKILSAQYKPIPDVYSDDLNKLIKKLLSKNPKHRPTLDEILNYDYVRYHLQQFSDHVDRHVWRRKASFKRSLLCLNLPSNSAAPIPSSSLDTPSSSGSASSPFTSRLRKSSFLDASGSPLARPPEGAAGRPTDQRHGLSRERTTSDPGGPSVTPSADSFNAGPRPNLTPAKTTSGGPAMGTQGRPPLGTMVHGGGTTVTRQSSGLFRPYSPALAPTSSGGKGGSKLGHQASRVPRITEDNALPVDVPMKIRRSHSDTELADFDHVPQSVVDSGLADLRHQAAERRKTRDSGDGKPPPGEAVPEPPPLSMSQIFRGLQANGLADIHQAVVDQDEQAAAAPAEAEEAPSMPQQQREEHEALVHKLAALKGKLGIPSRRLQLDLVPEEDGNFRWVIAAGTDPAATEPSSPKRAQPAATDFRYRLVSATSEAPAEAEGAGGKGRGTQESVATCSSMSDDDAMILGIQKRLEENTDDSNEDAASEASRDMPKEGAPTQAGRRNKYNGLHHDWDATASASAI